MLTVTGHHRFSEKSMKAVPKMNEALAPSAAACECVWSVLERPDDAD